MNGHNNNKATTNASAPSSIHLGRQDVIRDTGPLGSLDLPMPSLSRYTDRAVAGFCLCISLVFSRHDDRTYIEY